MAVIHCHGLYLRLDVRESSTFWPNLLFDRGYFTASHCQHGMSSDKKTKSIEFAFFPSCQNHHFASIVLHENSIEIIPIIIFYRLISAETDCIYSSVKFERTVCFNAVFSNTIQTNCIWSVSFKDYIVLECFLLIWVQTICILAGYVKDSIVQECFCWFEFGPLHFSRLCQRQHCSGMPLLISVPTICISIRWFLKSTLLWNAFIDLHFETNKFQIRITTDINLWKTGYSILTCSTYTPMLCFTCFAMYIYISHLRYISLSYVYIHIQVRLCSCALVYASLVHTFMFCMAAVVFIMVAMFWWSGCLFRLKVNLPLNVCLFRPWSPTSMFT